ncbi:sugar phosphate isomerase/epimerase [bacterium]|nr:sugar phosphate isomerase/epimerase [bacterium]
MANPRRREFIRLAGCGLAAGTLPVLPLPAKKGDNKKPSPLSFRLGVASYTFRNFNLEQTLDSVRKLGLDHLCLKSMHLPLESTGEQIRAVVDRIHTAGIRPYGAGVIYMNTESEVLNAFRYAKSAGLDIIIGVPDPSLLKRVDEQVKSQGIRLAIHNHGPDNDLYPTPESIYRSIRDLDPGIGLCVDVGHTIRAGVDPCRALREYSDRVLDIHIKDVTAASREGNTIEIGRGVIDTVELLKTLVKTGFSGVAAFEFEKDGENPMPGLAESVGFVRGVLSTMGYRSNRG